MRAAGLSLQLTRALTISSLAPLTVLFALALAPGVRAQGDAPAPSLRTRWTSAVQADHVLPEYPRPQLVRARWQSLNGPWQYAVRDSAAPRPERFDGTILVPFAIESQLSGVRRAVTERERLWYRRTFRLPRTPRGWHWLLHFGAVDWDATVFVNGRRLGEHRGGYDPFSFDITGAVRAGSEQELVVSVWDPTDRGEEPRGKQVLKPEGIWYTAVTGIWQTVWLEPVPPAYVQALRITPRVDQGAVTIAARTSGSTEGARLSAAVLVGDRVVARGEGPASSPLRLPLREPHLWSPDDPFLYRLRVALTGGDSLESYFGMRAIAVASDSAGARRLFLNGRPLFELGTLDQGWWPDGLYTAPTDQALRSDLETLKRLGFNTVRKHVKVEPERWYYHCDRLGVLVWQDMPSGDNRTAAGREQFGDELARVVEALGNHPSIVMWVPFNEGWGQHDTERYVAWLEAHDSTRLTDGASGWLDRGVGPVHDIHEYPGPAMPAALDRRAPILGEFGGLGLPMAGHTWLAERNWGYRQFTDTTALRAAYRDLITELRALEGAGLAAAIYTQTTDVEIEVNGILTYDRGVVKLSPDAAAWNRRLYAAPPLVRPVVPVAAAPGEPWRFTERAPEGAWLAPGYDAAGWRAGPGGFGADTTSDIRVRTQWETPDIWLRRTFELATASLVNPHWRIAHAGDVEVYLNGELVLRLSGATNGYVMPPLSLTAIAALRAGINTLAVHARQGERGRHLDLGLDDVIER